MSRFGPSRGSVEVGTSPTAKRSSSPVSSPKKKAFVSTIKSKETFGTPPPLPALQDNLDGKWNLDSIVPEVGYNIVSDPDALATSHVHLLQKQSVRWLNLSLNLWSLTVLDVYRTVTIESIAQFLEVVSWRAHGKVTEEEFSVLFSEWVAKPDKSNSQSKKVTVGVFGVRQLLLEKKYGETDLDLCIGIIINEINIRLLNSSVSYVNKKGTAGNQQNPYSLEVCSEKWLSLCEELFFTLDTPGYGVLRFDEAFFYCTCVTIGMQGWDTEEELEADLSLGTLTATTLQFMSDAGAGYHIRSGHTQDLELAWALDSNSGRSGGSGRKTQSTSQLHSQSGRVSNGKCEITLAMFKRYFLKRNVGEASLVALLGHVRNCVERIVRLARVNRADELYQACKPYEAELGSVGSARLWQQAVLSASGHVYQASQSDAFASARNANGSRALNDGGTVPQGGTPPIILFLLSDAERLLSGSLRANELPTDGTGFLSSPTSSSHSYCPMESATAANEELHECVYRIWNQFRRWGNESSSMREGSNVASLVGRPSWGLGYASGIHNPQSFFGSSSQSDIADVQRDPLYQLILTVVLQFKSLQQLLLAAFFDMTLSHFGVGSGVSQNSQAGPLVVICAGLVPNPQRLLVDLGFSDEKSSWNDPATGLVAGMRSNSTPSKDLSGHSQPPQQPKNLSSHDIPENNPQEIMTANESMSAHEGPVPAPPPRRRRPTLNNQESAPLESDSDFPSSAVGTEQRNKLEAETASSAARKRASQRIQEQRKAMGVDTSSVEDEVAQAKWSPLFNTQKVSRSDSERTGVAESKPTSRRTSKPPAAESSSSNAVSVNSRNASLSDEEAQILSEILSTSDVSKQNDLIERMKRLRLVEVGVTAPSGAPADPVPSAEVPVTRTDGEMAATSGTEVASFGQFQKLEERVLNEHDRRLSMENTRTESATVKSRQSSERADQFSEAQETANPPMSDAASAGPSSIEELLQQGQGTGQYAQMLREILRKMSKDDSTLQLKSLEQVLQLGHSIAQQDSQERLNEARIQQGQERRRAAGAGGSNGRTPSPRRIAPAAASASASTGIASSSFTSHSQQSSSGGRGQNSHNSSFVEESSDLDTSFPPSTLLTSRNSAPLQGFTPKPTQGKINPNGSISRLAKVPGLTPDPSAKKIKKVFGHAVK